MNTNNAQDSLREKRRYIRINTSNFIEYILYDEKQNKLERGEGRTLNLSQGGALLETQKPLLGSFVVIFASVSKKNNLQVKGRIVHTRKPDNSSFFLTGIEFVDTRDEQINDLIAFVKAYSSCTKVMVIDDDPTTRSFLENILRKREFQTLQAQNGKIALNEIQSAPPDLIISDVMMPEMGGFELCEKLRQSPATADIPFIFLSVKDDPVDQLKGLRMGADEYLVKPFKSTEILQAVTRVMEKSARLKGLRADVDIEGNLARIGLIEVIQMIEFNEKTGTLFLLSPANRVKGAVYIKEGQVVNAVSGDLDGEDAFYDLAGQTEGFFKFNIQETILSNKIRQKNMNLLMEASRLLDEAAALRSMISEADVRLILLTSAVPRHVVDRIPAEVLRSIMNLIRSGRTVNEIQNNAGISRLRASAVLAELINCGILAEHKADRQTGPQILPETAGTLQEDEGLKGTLVKMLERMEKNSFTGTISVQGRSEPAAIYMVDGMIVNATFGKATGRKALFRIFSERGGTCSKTKGPVKTDRRIDAYLSDLLRDAGAEIVWRKNLNTDFSGVSIMLSENSTEQQSALQTDPHKSGLLRAIRENSNLKDIIESSPFPDLETCRLIDQWRKKGVLLFKRL
ncbi:MAG: response regulator [Desulfobacterales bacterium]|nr:response regulator [Desulfobacterales bacterium]